MEPRSGSGSIVVAQVYYPYYLPPAVAHFPHGGLNDEQTLQTNVAPYFFLMAPLKITLRAGNRCKCFNINISGVVFHKGLSCESLVEMDVGSQNGVAQIYKKGRKTCTPQEKTKV